MKNNYEIRGSVTAILFDDNREALIDTDDLEKMEAFKGNWTINNSNPGKIDYVYGYHCGCVTLLHRFIMATPKGMVTDHINHDGLNNQKYNLRVLTQGQNLQNKNVCKNSKSGIRGVYWDISRNCWRIEIKLNGKKIYQKRFNNILDAEIDVKKMRTLLLPYSV